MNKKPKRKIIREIPGVPMHIMHIKDGYEMDSQSGEMFHRHVYQDHHGLIKKGWIIHHIDGKRTNNHIENLIALPRGYHDLLHIRFKKPWELPQRLWIEIDLKAWLKQKQYCKQQLKKFLIMQKKLHFRDYYR